MVDWCTAMMRHNMTDCLGADDRGVWFGLSWCEHYKRLVGVLVISVH